MQIMELRVQVKGEREKREKGREKLREREKMRKERGQKWREKD